MVGRQAITSAIVESHHDLRRKIDLRPPDSRRSAPSASSPSVIPAPARYPLLRPEDEDEIEAMFQRLKSAGTMDVRNESEN